VVDCSPGWPERIYEVIFNWDYYGRHLSKIPAVWGGRPRLYSVGRFLIEAIRIDSFWLGPFRVAQLASIVGVTVATAGLLGTRPRGPAP
jgi:prolipoprotein diacylglyceryltransferase